MFEPVLLNFPAYSFKIKQEIDVTYIFDELRKKFLVLTPEEWVRQHVVKFLILEKGYPRSLIQLEGGLKLNTLQKRTDIIVFNNKGEKVLLIECKAPSIKITQKVFDQIARYNIIHKVPLLFVSNGLEHFVCEIDLREKKYHFVDELPHFSK
ncbi:MAG: type I restriction enzyme HsdR N-terminal domain-containing protein [Pyrinomonadaceae bacterium]|nr:type I restriction enzyme HsdR N-terminal domain-containing protein [Sphingobacteriaceae bacterium]